MATKTHLLIFFSFALMALSIADATTITASINGTLFCTVNGGPGVNGSATPVFANATVQLRCLGNTVVASATTNSTGMFTITLTPSQTVSLVSGSCQLLVATPLVRCNSTLPADRLLRSTAIRFNGATINGTAIILNFVAVSFALSVPI